MNRILTVLVLAMLAREGISVYAACVEPPPIEVEFNQSAAVFRGKVTSLEPLDNYSSIATFEVDQWWKGERTATVKVQSCGGKPPVGTETICVDGPFKFRIGVRYVVFAFQEVSHQGPPLFASQEAADAYRAPPPSEPRLSASSCGRTVTEEEAAKAGIIKWLNAR